MSQPLVCESAFVSVSVIVCVFVSVCVYVCMCVYVCYFDHLHEILFHHLIFYLHFSDPDVVFCQVLAIDDWSEYTGK